METAWSCMWNVTDETPINCKRFLDGDGMDLFLRCKTEFPNKQDLLRNMMGLLGNVAEVPNLRSHLMNADFVAEFHFLLNSTSDGIEVWTLLEFYWSREFSVLNLNSSSRSVTTRRAF